MKDFGVVKPKLAVLGLNPHAGENGKMGRRRIKEMILPAINSQKKQGVCFWPLSF